MDTTKETPLGARPPPLPSPTIPVFKFFFCENKQTNIVLSPSNINDPCLVHACDCQLELRMQRGRCPVGGFTVVLARGIQQLLLPRKLCYCNVGHHFDVVGTEGCHIELQNREDTLFSIVLLK